MFWRRKRCLLHSVYLILIGLKCRSLKQQDLDRGLFYLYYNHGPGRDKFFNGKLIPEADWIFGKKNSPEKERAIEILICSMLRAEAEQRLKWPTKHGNHCDELNELLKDNGFSPIPKTEEMIKNNAKWFSFEALGQGTKKIGLKLF